MGSADQTSALSEEYSLQNETKMMLYINRALIQDSFVQLLHVNVEL